MKGDLEGMREGTSVLHFTDDNLCTVYDTEAVGTVR